METRKILTIWVLVLAVTVWPIDASQATPMGTAFTYQGRLIDANSAADGLYDFQFKLFDANVAGTQQGSTIDINDLDIIDGYFTVELDFGPVYDGNAMWLGIEVRAGEANDPNGYMMLSPRQQVTPTPYALYAKTAGNALTGSGTTNRIAKFTGPCTLGDSALYEHNYYVGVGTANPRGKFDVDCDGGDIYLDTFSSQVYIGDVDGDGDETLFTVDDNAGKFTFENGKVGIGTTTPESRLHLSDAGSVGLFIEADTDNSDEADQPSIILSQDGGVVQGKIGFFGEENKLSIYNTYGDDLKLGTNNDSNMVVIRPSGNVGVGTTNPGAKLEVKQNSWQDIVKVGTPDTSNRLILSSGPDYASVSGGQTNQNSIVISHSTGNVGIGPSLSLPQAKLQVNGDLKVKGDVTVDGAYVGTFPRPAYDSGWVPLLQGQELTCIHNLGGNVDNYVVDLQMKWSGVWGIHNYGIGIDKLYDEAEVYRYRGVFWKELTTTSIKAQRGEHDGWSEQVRIRIWVYK